ncbi:MAG: hypothetical protein H7246_04145 [Phycisphaerae bacterium]|nr:hypothetical protein [Saprospiraceae bacterium]
MFQKLLPLFFAALCIFTKRTTYRVSKFYTQSKTYLVKTPSAADQRWKPVLRFQILGRIAFFLSFFASTLFAQTAPEVKKPGRDGKSKGVLAHFALGGHLPAGDLADRFGVNGSLGAGTEFITPKNWAFGLEGAFLFGSKVKEDPLSILRTPAGDIIGNDRNIAVTRVQERGMYLGATIGKLLTFSDKRAGLRLTLGGGWAQHSIRVLDDSRSVAQIKGEYKKGYDRLCGGPALQQFVGWQHLGYGRDVSWMLGFEFNQAFTETRRDWDFSEMRKLEGKRLDLRFGVRLAWTLPFYTGNAEEIYY